MTALALQTIFGGLIIFAVSIPLALRRVPMNWWYGFRIPAAFRSDQRWYDINAYGGRHMARWSLLIVAAGLLGFLLPENAVLAYRRSVYVVVFIAVAVPIVRTLLWTRHSNKA